jgi:sigma-B regulation protein RsbU (phosphoserine phosphatase)
LGFWNAGHNSPYLVRHNGNGVEALRVTGMPIGIEEEAFWEQRTIQLDPGDALVMFTDGIPDAQNEDGEFFEDESLVEVVQMHVGCPAHEIQSVVIDQVQRFVGNAPQFDDITLMVLTRDLANSVQKQNEESPVEDGEPSSDA